MLSISCTLMCGSGDSFHSSRPPLLGLELVVINIQSSCLTWIWFVSSSTASSSMMRAWPLAMIRVVCSHPLCHLVAHESVDVHSRRFHIQDFVPHLLVELGR